MQTKRYQTRARARITDEVQLVVFDACGEAPTMLFTSRLAFDVDASAADGTDRPGSGQSPLD